MGGAGSIPATAAAWSVLSRACHHHPYELAATANELRDVLDIAHRFAAEVTRQSCPAGTTLALLPSALIAYTERCGGLCQRRDRRQYRARGSVCMTTATANEHIEITPGVCGGKPRVAGHRITVANIVIWHERLGKSADEIATEYDLTLADVYAALGPSGTGIFRAPMEALTSK